MPTTLESSIAESTLRPGDEEGSGDKREIGADAVWTLSTAKPGNGVEQLRDNNTETYWQSDGPQPHLVNIQFHKKMLIKEIAIYCDHKHDESYTPSKLSIRAGTHFHDLQEVKEVTLEEPSGWIRIPLRKSDLHRPGTVTCSGGNIVAETDTNECLRAFMLQVAILANHENGRDSHIRQIKVFAPRPAGGSGGIGLWTGLGEGEDCFSTPQFAVMSLIR